MVKKVFRPIAIALAVLISICFTYEGNTGNWPANNNLPSSVYASTHGFARRTTQPHPLNPRVEVPGTEFHVHCIAAAHWDRQGYYNLHAKVEEAEDAPWWVFAIEDDDDNMSTYFTGCREFAYLHYFKFNISPEHAVWKARAYIKDETTGASDGEYNENGMVQED